jgi:histidinol-phosphate aminotransferase
MRVGLAFGSEALVRELMKVKDSYNVSRPAQAAACAALADDVYFRNTRDAVKAGRERFTAALVARGFQVLPSFANFVFVVPPRGLSAKSLYEKLLTRGFLVRHLSGPAVSDGLRISMGSDPDMAALAGVIAEEADGS